MIYQPLSDEQFEDLAKRILYEDNHVLVLNKNVGEIVQADKTQDEPLSETLKAFIAQRDQKPGRVFMGVPHRLDRPVSGVTLFAKTSKALERMSESFREGEVHKIYWALLCAKPSAEQAELVHYIVRNEKQNKSYCYNEPRPDAKKAVLRYKLLKSFDRYHLVEVELLTGRHHQIRAQMAAIGCPIKGDLKYGAARSNRDGGINLHAHSISFIHPTRKESVTVSAEVDWTPFVF